jgi:hypothetical protein
MREKREQLYDALFGAICAYLVERGQCERPVAEHVARIILAQERALDAARHHIVCLERCVSDDALDLQKGV